MAGKRKSGLGTGLDSLFKSVEVDPDAILEPEAGLIRIDIDSIKPNADQPRKTFDKGKIEEMAESIKAHGVIQPLVVRKSKNGYEIVAGERRWRAAKEAGLESVPCVLRELDDKQNMIFAIVENMQREDLNPVEEAQGLEKMIKVYGLTQEEVARTVGKSRPYITNALRLLKLEKPILEKLSAGLLSAAHGRTLVGISDPKRRKALAERTIKEGLSVRALETLAGEKPKKRGKPAKRAKDPDAVSVERELTRHFGTKVEIKGGSERGRLEINYFNLEELNRIIEMLRTAKKH